MDFIPKDRILEHKPNTLEVIRKQYNLDKPGQMKQAINILHDWVQKQDHFKKKDFSEHYYELCIIGCKGSIERSKARIDKMCTLRTLLPQMFGTYNMKEDFSKENNTLFGVVLPKLTDDHYRVINFKLYDAVLTSSMFTNYFRTNIIIADYLKIHDYINGFILILDFTEANMMDCVTKLNPIELRQIASILIEGFGMRLQGIHIISKSRFVDALVSLIKQIVSPKIAGRVYVHKTVEGIYKYVPKSILPKDYDGEERPLKELFSEWLDILSSEEHIKYLQEINEAVTDESCRQRHEFNELYAGMPGTFKLLNVD